MKQHKKTTTKKMKMKVQMNSLLALRKQLPIRFGKLICNLEGGSVSGKKGGDDDSGSGKKGRSTPSPTPAPTTPAPTPAC
jgi:hypothetical protein